jgi:hypothetical protein
MAWLVIPSSSTPKSALRLASSHRFVAAAGGCQTKAVAAWRRDALFWLPPNKGRVWSSMGGRGEMVPRKIPLIRAHETSARCHARSRPGLPASLSLILVDQGVLGPRRPSHRPCTSYCIGESGPPVGPSLGPLGGPDRFRGPTVVPADSPVCTSRYVL